MDFLEMLMYLYLIMFYGVFIGAAILVGQKLLTYIRKLRG